MKKTAQFLFRVLLIVGIITAGMVLVLTSCLNPIGFNPELSLKVDIEGQIDTRILNDAVIWIINRSKTVDVTNFEITRPRIPDEKNYQYPKTFTNRPLRGTSHASYHLPTDEYYHIKIEWRDDHPKTPSNKKYGIYERKFQFPRPYDYKFYLYRTKDGNTVVVDDDEMKELPDPGDTSNPPEPPGPGNDSRHTFVVMNMTKNMDIDEVELAKDGITYSITGEPLRKDQQMYRLYAGAYKMTASYRIGGVPKTTTGKNAIVVQEAGAQSLRSNYMYFYRTRSGGYELTPFWPPGDAADEENVNPEDVLDDNHGILEIQNNAVPNNPHSIIARIYIDGKEFPNAVNTSPYMLPGANGKNGDVERFVLPVGTVSVKFMPIDRLSYGMMIPRMIKSKKVTVLPYTNDLASPDVIPPDYGFGSGLIRIKNNANGVVNALALYDNANLSVSRIVPYNNFDPPYPLSYGGMSRVAVVGDAAFPVTPGGVQLIQVTMMTKTGPVVVEKLAALYNNIVDIVISQADIELKPNQTGARITVFNSTSTPSEVVNVEVYDTAVPGNKTLFTSAYWTPHGVITNGTNAVFDVISSPLMPITKTAQFRTKLAVTVTRPNGAASGYVYKNLSPDILYGELPGNTRTITLTESDIAGIVPPPQPPQFIPVTDVRLESHNIVKGTSTQLKWDVYPDNATNKNGFWTVYLSDSTYSITQDGLVWIAASRSYDYLYVAHVIPNGTAPGTRRPSFHIVPEVGIAQYDSGKDFFQVYKLNIKTSGGGSSSTSTVSTFLKKDNAGALGASKLIFRPTNTAFSFASYSAPGRPTNTGLSMNPTKEILGSKNANDAISKSEIPPPDEIFPSESAPRADIVIDLGSIGQGSIVNFEIPKGRYYVCAVSGNNKVWGKRPNQWLTIDTEQAAYMKPGFKFYLSAETSAVNDDGAQLHLRVFHKDS